MIVKIGDKVYDAEEEPIMLILSDSDKENLANMHSDKNKFITFPEGMDIKEVREFMKIEDKE